MIRVGVIGVGNAGNQNAVLAKKELAIPVLAVNTSEQDLSTLPADVPKLFLKNNRGTTEGAGKDRSTAKKYLKESIQNLIAEEMTKFVTSLDVVYIVSSTAGGSGSGIAPVLYEILSQMYAKPIAEGKLLLILVGITPVVDEALIGHTNTLEYLKELYEKLKNPIYMLYDNAKMGDSPAHIMMNGINHEFIEDINVMRGYFNNATPYASIDSRDMLRLLGFKGRIVVFKLKDIKERDLDTTSIEDQLLNVVKNGNVHVELQRDKKVTATGIITSVSEVLANTFNTSIPKVREHLGTPIHDFVHLGINEDRKMPNNIYLIASGLSPVNDKIRKIGDRIEEITAKQEEAESNEDDASALEDIDLSALKSKTSDDKGNDGEEITGGVDVRTIFSNFEID